MSIVKNTEVNQSAEGLPEEVDSTKLNRREFLGTAGAAAGTVVLCGMSTPLAADTAEQILSTQPARTIDSSNRRRKIQSFKLRVKAATNELILPQGRQRTNGDERRF